MTGECIAIKLLRGAVGTVRRGLRSPSAYLDNGCLIRPDREHSCQAFLSGRRQLYRSCLSVRERIAGLGSNCFEYRIAAG